jgi:hypothetical protein
MYVGEEQTREDEQEELHWFHRCRQCNSLGDYSSLPMVQVGEAELWLLRMPFPIPSVLFHLLIRMIRGKIFQIPTAVLGYGICQIDTVLGIKTWAGWVRVRHFSLQCP